MASHSSVLAWRIPGTVEPSGLPSTGPHRVGHDWSDLAAAAATSTGSSKKQESSRKTSTFALLTMPKHLCGSQQSVENYSRDGDTRSPDLPPEKSICRSRSNSYTGHGTTDWLQIWKGVHQGCILLLCLFNLYAEYIMQNAGLDEAQAGYCWEKYQ